VKHCIPKRHSSFFILRELELEQLNKKEKN